ncbi:MAG: 2-amino-thiazoline-4-carboxylic acid hydrolase [Rhodospirillaceae bacterium]|nr:2-amino-thiazoline-4-carboxylic acid hydrolase [Rhodospirillaceae bacterium]|tara:strand:- start:103 stop:567 length:465 start_codon:yes stop_codon:yes gene_type:complete
MNEIPILEIRRIEANIIRPIYEQMVSELGREKAQQILGLAIEKAAIEQGKSMAEESADGPSLRAFIHLFERWKMGGALEVEVLHESDDQFDFNVTRCRYAEMYQDMGMGDIGHLLSCARDGSFCTGYDPRIELDRGQTIMGGSSHCNFRYRVKR